MLACKYVEKKGLTAMLAAKRSAGVAPEVNLKECTSPMPLPSANKASHSGFETTGDVTRNPKQWPHNPSGCTGTMVRLFYDHDKANDLVLGSGHLDFYKILSVKTNLFLIESLIHQTVLD